MSTTIGSMLMQALTLDEARERLGLTAREMDSLVEEGRITAEHDANGLHITEEAIAAFQAAERRQKLHAMEEITEISNQLGFIE